MSDLRPLVAETLAAHRDELRGGRDAAWHCTCGQWSWPLGDVPATVVDEDHRLHRADAILAALAAKLGQTREEWGRPTVAGGVRACLPFEAAKCPTQPEQHVRRRITEWPDGSVYTGPWQSVGGRAS